MRKPWTNLFRKFRDNTGGNVAMIFGLTIIPLVAVAGFAVDLQHTTMKKNRIQVILDSAVLAAAKTKQGGGTDDQITKTVRDFLDQQSYVSSSNLWCGQATVVVSTTNEDIYGKVSCKQDTSLMNVVGIEYMPFSVESTATYGIGKVDVAFMFDVSGSMNSSGRLTSLKLAAQDAVDILVPANATGTESDVRIAMSSYNAMVDAGPYFEKATGQPARRTYTHIIEGEDAPDAYAGTTTNDFFLGLYDGDTNELIAELGDDAVIYIEDHQWDDLNIGLTFPSGTTYRGRVESVRFDLSGERSEKRTENVEPYALHGDSGGNYYGERYYEGLYRLRVRGYRYDNASGSRRFNRYYKFTLHDGEDKPDITKRYTLTSTCVWERDGDEKFTDAKPGPGAYLAHQQAWFIEDDSQSDGGDWEVGHPNRGGSKYDGDECRDIEPLKLTDNRTSLSNYISGLDAGGYTAGHLGVAWSWYLISENWNSIFTGTGAPLDYNEPDSVKAVILMTDGSFNTEIFPEQGDSATQARALCTNMKAKGIKVYSVAMQAPTAGQQVLRDCATNDDFYFNAQSRQDLIDAYNEIAQSIADLRIIR